MADFMNFIRYGIQKERTVTIFRDKMFFLYLCHPLIFQFRDVAQPGSALAWGARGRKFESCRPDK